MSADAVIADLRRIPVTAQLSDERLRWLAERVEPRLYEAGEDIFVEGGTAHEFFLLLDGRVETLQRIDGEEVSVADHREYSFVGAISLLGGDPYPGTTRALTRTRSLIVPEEAFFDLVRDEERFRRDVLATFQPVFQRWAAMQGQREKLAALGELSAGLAHELNNPAAAAVRAARELGDTLAMVQEGVGRAAEAGLTAEQLTSLSATAKRARQVALEAGPLDALDRSDREGELAAVLESHGVEDPYDLAADLVEAGMEASCTEQIAADVGPRSAAGVLTWVAAGARADALARELAEATHRISTLVRAVKEYTYMDQAPSQDVDVHRGLETTLTMLGHKLKKGDVRVVRELQPDLPRIHAYGSELNQVWTNLLDNAIDAVDGDGTITLRSSSDGAGHVRVEIADDGPGIPDDVRSRIFEPFFTTKDVGNGTGMGLDVAYRIVVQRHRGDLRVESQPGATRFVVRLPVQPQDAPVGAAG